MAHTEQVTSAAKTTIAAVFVAAALSPPAIAQMSGTAGMFGMSGMSGQYRVAPDGSIFLFPSGMSGMGGMSRMGGMSGMGGAHYDKWRTWQRPFRLENPRQLYGQ